MSVLADIVSSRVKAELFRLLFGLGAKELHLREIARQANLSLATVQQELRRLVRIGLVVARRESNRVYYRANSEHPIYSDLNAIVLKTDGLVGILQEALNVADVELAFVFGSVARGETTGSSDIDVMVIGSAGLRHVSSLLSGTADRVRREINPHVMTTQEWVARRAKGDHFVTSVLASPRLFIKGNERELTTVGQ